ncbi:MAG: PHP domain-containing protein, partial [Firmicutes bacterium]|nr:PHP domain-containing protein [Bacillota bacterium]
MRNLIDTSISWDRLGDHERQEYQYWITDAVINSETGVLTITLRLNFVMPVIDMEKLSGIILHQFSDLKSVEFRYEFADIIQTKEEIIPLFIPHMIRIINGKYASITKTIEPEKFELDGENLVIYALGKFSTEQLNERVALQFQHLLNSHFGLQYKVCFKNDESMYASAKENWMIQEARDIQASIEDDRVKAAEARRNSPVAVSGGNSVTAGSGNGFGGGFKSPGGNGGGNGFRRREKELPAEGNRIMGKDIFGDAVEISSIDQDTGNVILEGILFKKDHKVTKTGRVIATLLITDKKDSACLKTFCSKEKWDEIDGLLKSGDFIKVRGETEWDRFENCLTVMIKDINKGKSRKRLDTYEGGKRVELHAHTKMSSMDGLNEVSTLVNTAAKWGQPAVAITDHGVVQSFPDAAKAAKKLAGNKDNPIYIKIIYGMEGYVFDDTNYRLPDGEIDFEQFKEDLKKSRKNKDGLVTTNHIIFLAQTQEGLKNIYKLVSYSHLQYFYNRPLLPKSVISEHREGIIIGSACEAGEVYQAVRKGLPDAELDDVASFYDYLEIQPLINNRFMIENGMVSGYDELKEHNRKIVALGDRLGKLVVATTDAHYDEPDSAIYRNILMAGMGFKDAESGQGLYMRTTNEMMDEFAYLGEETAYKVVIENTNKIADMIDGDILPVPKGKFPPKIAGAEETLRKTCMDKAHSIYGEPLPPEIGSRLETELNSIIGNGYAVMYVSAQMLVHKSMEDGYLVGSRGSVGSSFAATMAGITEVNPLDPHYICPNCKHLEWGDMQLYDCGIDMPEKECPECGTMMNRDGYTIPFATFLGFNGDKEPDIDLNFAGEYQAIAHKYVGEIFGEKNVFKAGTVGTVADKTAFGYVKKFGEEFNRPINKFEAER